MIPEKKVLCEQLEKLLSRGKGFDVPWNRKNELYGNPHKVEWLQKNLKARNESNPAYSEAMSLITKILN